MKDDTKEKNRSKIAKKQLSDYAMAFDLMGNIAQSGTEKETIQRILELCHILFAPKKLLFVSIENNKPIQAYSLFSKADIDDSFKSDFTDSKPYYWTDSKKGFRIKITHKKRLLGILEIDEITLPEFKEHYLNLTLSIADVMGLAIENAKRYQKIETTKNELKIEKEKLDVTFRSIGEGIITVDISGKVSRMNKVAEKLTEWNQSKAVGEPWDTVFKIVNKKNNEGIDIISEILESDQILKNSEDVFLISSTGSKYDITFSATPIKDVEFKTFSIAIVFRDVTEENKIRKEMTKIQKIGALGTLTGGVAHDFNNILFPIIGFTEMSLKELPENHSVAENLEQVLKGAKRAQDVVKRLLSFSHQGESGIVNFRIQPVIKDAIKLIRSTIPKNIEIIETISTSPIVIYADPSEIHEVVINLCINAYHAVETCGGKIEVSITEEHIMKDSPSVESNTKTGKFGCIKVTDSGVGIDEDTMDKIFDPYFTTKGLAKGSGLGLSVSYGIIDRLNGFITVESVVDKGSTFNVYIPLSKNSKLDEQKSLTLDLPKGNERILVVDDEDAIVNMIEKILRNLGYTVTGETSSVSALETFKSHPDAYDFVITDMAMPDMVGAELANKILGIRPNTPIMICTGFSERFDNKKALSLGIKDYINKPILLEELSRKIRKILDEMGKENNG